MTYSPIIYFRRGHAGRGGRRGQGPITSIAITILCSITITATYYYITITATISTDITITATYYYKEGTAITIMRRSADKDLLLAQGPPEYGRSCD